MADENRNFLLEKVKLGKFSTETETFFGNRGKFETGGNAPLPQGGWTPLRPVRVKHDA